MSFVGKTTLDLGTLRCGIHPFAIAMQGEPVHLNVLVITR